VGGEGATLPLEPLVIGESGQLTHTWGLPGESKRRAAVNKRPAGSKWMRSGSPSDNLFEIVGGRVNKQRAVGTPFRTDPASAAVPLLTPRGHSSWKQMVLGTDSPQMLRGWRTAALANTAGGDDSPRLQTNAHRSTTDTL